MTDNEQVDELYSITDASFLFGENVLFRVNKGGPSIRVFTVFTDWCPIVGVTRGYQVLPLL
jgi:hypothetical protein